MSPARVLVAVAIATALVVAAFVVLRRPGPAAHTPAALLLPFDPPLATELTVTRPDGRVEAVKPGGGPGEWVIEVRGAGGASVWPAATANVRAAFKILAGLSAVRTADAGASLGPDATRVVVEAPGGAYSLRIDGRVLAGNVLAEVELPHKQSPVWIESSFAEMLVKAGPREWRDTRVLPEVADASRITLVSGATTIGLARVQGRWGVREPVVEAAEPEAISRLASGLAGTQILDFLDGGAPASGQTGLDSPAASVVVEIDRRDPGTGQSAAAVSTLTIGQPSDMSGKGVFGSLARPGQPERTVVVSAEALAGLSRDPATYVSRRAVTTPAADVGGVTIGGEPARRFSRSIDGWRAERGAGQDALPATAPDASELDALLKMLTEARAESVALDPSAGPGGVAVELTSIGGAPVREVSLMLDSDPATHKAVLLIRSGAVVRRYSGSEATATWQWVSGR